jgi:hypothetical protein
MADTLHWTCPYCGRAATLREHDYEKDSVDFAIQNPADGPRRLQWHYIVCPSPDCRKFTLAVDVLSIVRVNRASVNGGPYWGEKELLESWSLIPPSSARVFPDYVPRAVVDDYNEACLIVELSPKASATLARRCLQGILRDFWKVKPGNLNKEIEQLQDRVDAATWEAIDAVRKVGNIGAHMEKDINLIVDVEPEEAKTLIRLIEMLIKDWYIGRREREDHLAEITGIAAQKDAERKGNGESPTDV